ncbi:threonine synthase [Staphylococcus aureus]
MRRWQGLVEEFKAHLPVNENTPKLTLNEGNTPLIHCENMSKILGIDLYVKYEGANPTGSFKDRGMVMAVTKAKEQGKKIVICASTGNTSASAAAYAARAGLKAIVVIPEGKIALGKLSQAVMYGAEIVSIEGNFDEALEIVKEIAKSGEIELVNSVNPFRIEGQKTGSFEIVQQLDGEAPDILAIPVGNAGNITAYWKGFKEYHEAKGSQLPKMFGFQAEGASPIVQNKVIKNPETIATAIRIGNPASWDKATNALKESNGLIDSVTDDEILEAYQLMTTKEGVFSEPASNASIAGLIKLHRQGKLPQGKKRDLKLPEHHSYIISYNGSKTINMTNEEVEVSKSIGKQDFDEIVDYCRDRGFFVLTYHDGQIIYDSEHEYMNIEAELTGLPMKRVDDIKAYIQGDVPKVMGVDYVANITEARIDLNGVFNDNVDATTSKPFFLEFMAKDVSKGNAIKALCHKLGYSVDQVIAFGDSMNDKSMFEVAGLAIAMGNASDELKQYADEVTLDHNENGIPHALKKLL